MSLRVKTSVILVIIVATYIGLSFALQRGILMPGFRELEEQEAREDTARVVVALQREAENVDSFCQDWAAWNDTYAYVIDHNKAYEDTNLADATFQQDKLNLIYVLDQSGAVVFGRACELAQDPKDAPTTIALPDFPDKLWAVTHPLLQHDGVLSKIIGAIRTSHGPMLIASRPITTTERQGPIRGTLILGRFLDENVVEAVREQTLLRVRIEALPDRPSPDAAVYPSGSPAAYSYDKTSPTIVRVTTIFPDISGKPLLRLRVETLRDIMQSGMNLMRITMWAMMGTGIAVLIAMLLFLERSILGPLLRLTGHVKHIFTEDDLLLIDMPTQNDEVGTLASEFNRMIRRVRHDKAERRQAEAGMQEMKARVLQAEHLATLGEMGAAIAHEMRNPLAGISGALQVLRGEFAEDDPKRDIMEEVLAQVRRMDMTVTHLLMFTKPWEPTKKPCDLRALANRVCDAAVKTNDTGIRFTLEGSGPVMADIDALLIDQVFQNLVSNAIDAIRAAAPPEPEIRWTFKHTAQTTSVVLHDNGNGVDPDVQSQLFRPFFTTKTYGTGLGLVICRRIVEAHGGTIAISSISGKGTDVTVTFTT